MDDHPPDWSNNGNAALALFVPELKPNTARVNLFLPVAHDALAKPLPDPVAFSRALVDNFSLTSVELYRCNLGQEGIAAIAQALSVNKYITYLGLSRNRFYSAGGVMLAEMLKVNQTLLTLDLSWNELRDECILSLSEALTMNHSLQRLMLDKNRITGDGASAFGHALSLNRRLRYVSLSQNQIAAFGAGFVAKALAANASTALQTLNIAANAVPSEGMFSFFSHIASMAWPAATLVTLNVGFNKIGNAVLLLGTALMKLPSLRELNLENCLLQHTPELHECCRAIAAHKCLVNLNVSRNPGLGDGGLDAFCEALAVAATIKYVDVSDVGATKAALDESLVKLLKHCTALSTLHLSDNEFSQEGAGHSLAKLLSVSTSLTFLGLQRCGLGLAQMDGLCTTLQFRSLALAGLSLRGNRFGDAGFAQLLPWVLHHGHFRWLDVAQNDLTAFVQPRLPDVFQANCDLAYIVLEDDTVITPQNAREPWDAVQHVSAAPSALSMLPPLTQATYELQTALPPTAGFATYSAAIGSALRRQVEESSSVVQGLLAYAGQPVQHTHVWSGNHVGTTPSLGSKEFQGGPSDPRTVFQLENNIGGLLLSDDQLRREFNRLDVKGNGYLSAAEFKRIYRTMEHYGVERSEGEIERVLARYGGLSGRPNDEGRITFDIFCVVMLKLAQH